MKESIVKKSKSCFFCGSEQYLDLHHCLHGTANRKLADEDGLTVYLCRRCHRKLHDTAEGRDMDLALKQAAEHAWLKHNHKTIADWIERYGRNYLRQTRR